MSRLLAVVVAVAATIVLAAPVHADTPDGQYLATLARHGVTGDPGVLTAAGNDVCWATEQSGLVIGIALWKPDAEYASQGLSWTQVQQAKRDAINSYCPDRAWWKD